MGRRHLIAALVGFACSSPDAPSDGPPNAAPGTPPMSIRAVTTSIPVDDVADLSLHVASVDGVFEGERRTLFHDTWLPLTDLTNGRTWPLGEASERPDRIVLRVTCAELTFLDGSTIEREYPLDGRDELDLAVDGGAAGDVVVLFDVERMVLRPSAAQVGRHEDVLVHPSARAIGVERLTTISGRVVDDNGTPGWPDDDRPMADTRVSLEQGWRRVADLRTESDGSYAFLGAYVGDFDVVCFPPSNRPDARAVTARARRTVTDQDFVFQLAEVDAGSW